MLTLSSRGVLLVRALCLARCLAVVYDFALFNTVILSEAKDLRRWSQHLASSRLLHDDFRWKSRQCIV